MSAAKKNTRKRLAKPAAGKEPFDVEAAISLLRAAVAPYPKAALFELAGDGQTSVFEILVAAVISIRTHDATVSTQPHLLATASALGHAGVN